MVTQNETHTGGAAPYSPDILDDLPIDDQLALEFFATARCASFKQAARGLNVPVVGLRKRLEKLEEHVGAPVFVYKHNKLALTRTGERVSQYLCQLFGPDGLGKDGEKEIPRLTLAITEPVLSDIVNRDLVAYVRDHAEMQLEIHSECTPRMLSEGEVDVGIIFMSPDDEDVLGRHPDYRFEQLGRIGHALFISSRYSRSVTLPVHSLDLHNFMLVVPWDDEILAGSQKWASIVADHQGGTTRVKSYNLSRGLVVGGACIGVLPDYSRKMEKNILPVPGFLDDLEEKDVYLVIKSNFVRHPQVLEIRRLIKKSFLDKKDWLVR
ncbi:LysR family transcriptional regulator [Pseudomonas sp. zfem004]|uniref:LysR family transcriptional regulator n=1 Tax=Pseudomonas sp. zfem004 TaxID=3078199 RepID=UPI002928715F|nr:LysR family transcriptional regulator [Pseudomonas sp. zfem004]MDU9402594.1 LysR family transcriptional regulator [Pseudomonas sp. zfem004]